MLFYNPFSISCAFSTIPTCPFFKEFLNLLVIIVLVFTVTYVILHLILVACLCRKGSDAEGNPAYGLCGPHERHGETKDVYEYIQSSAAAPQEAVYEVV